jgi:serine/threonine-protein kinase
VVVQSGPATQPDPASLAAGHILAGRYRLEHRLGQGGFATVFAATNLNDQTRVALKVMSPRVVEMVGGPERFRREADLAARLDHPAIVRVLDAGTDPAGALFIAFELLEGRSLEEEITRVGTLDPRRSAAIGIAVLEALEHAHARGIVHRDIKPANVFLPSGPLEGSVKVLDFGIAKSVNPGTRAGLTADGTSLGTPAYMAPEQIEGHDVGPSTDLYSLGLVIAEMICGRVLFGGMSPIEILSMRVTQRRLPFPQGWLRTPIGSVVHRATQADPAHRFPNAASMRAALQAAAAESQTNVTPQVVVAPTATRFGDAGLTKFASGPTKYDATPPVAHPVPWAPPQRAAPSSGGGGFVIAIAAIVIAGALGAVGAVVWLRANAEEPARRADAERGDDDDEAPRKRRRPRATLPTATQGRVAPEPTAPVVSTAPLPPPTPTPPPPPTSAPRIKPCRGVAALTPPALRRHLQESGQPIEGVVHHCAGNLINFRCDGPSGRGFSTPDGSAVLVHLPSPAAADTFARGQASPDESGLTLAVDGSSVLSLDYEDPVADRVLARVCK